MKLTSPNLNYFTIMGALVLYTGCVIYVTPSSSLDVIEHVCRVSDTINSLYMMNIAVCIKQIVLKFSSYWVTWECWS